MKTQKLTALLALVCLGLAAMAAPAQAGAGSRGEESLQGDIVVTFDGSAGRWKAANVVLYDEDWQVLEEAEANGRAHTFTGVDAGAYHVAAYSDESLEWMTNDVKVAAAQTARVQVKWNRYGYTAWSGYNNGRWCGGASGDGSLLKVYPPIGQNVIYLQCGRVVNKVFAGGGCRGCGGVSGGWRYVNECVKTAPIYVNLPCP